MLDVFSFVKYKIQFEEIFLCACRVEVLTFHSPLFCLSEKAVVVGNWSSVTHRGHGRKQFFNAFWQIKARQFLLHQFLAFVSHKDSFSFHTSYQMIVRPAELQTKNAQTIL